MTIGAVCRYCGCTNDLPCPISIEYLPLEERQIFPSAYFACHWVTVDVCSAPACVEKLYRHLVRTTVDVCSAPACVEKLYRHLVRTAEPIILAAMGYEFEELLLESDSHPGRAA